MKRPRSDRGSRRRRGRDRRSARRIAELEAEVGELRGKMAALEAVVGVDLTASDEVRALRTAQHRNGGGSGFGLLHVQHESGHRVAEAVLAALRTETGRLAATVLDRVSDAVLARWAMPHAVVPSLVAEHAVAPFAEPDWVVSGPDGTAVLETVPDAALKMDWRDDLACHTPTGQRLLMKLAGVAASADHVRTLCNLVLENCNDDEGMIPWSTMFFTRFFCRLAPLATTAEAVALLCVACAHNPPSTDGFVDSDSVLRFFVALVPAISTEVTDAVSHALMALVWSGSELHHGSFRAAFYREFVLPLARRASSPGMVSFVCMAFSPTFSASLEVTQDLPEILARFSRIATTEGRVRSFPSMIKCIARNAAMVELVSVDTVVLPLAPFISDKYEAGDLLNALEAIMEYRSRIGDVSRQQELEQAMQALRQVKNSRYMS